MKGLTSAVEIGEALGDIRDVFGDPLETIVSERNGFTLYNLSGLAVSRGEALLGIGTPLEE